MGAKAKGIGLLLVFAAIVCFLVNFHLWTPWLVGGLQWLWNPLSLLTPRIIGAIGSIPLLGNGLVAVWNYLFALAWSFMLLIIGVLCLLH